MAQTIRQQLQANAVALISLVVALGSLGYKVIVNFAFFAKNDQLGHPMAGWGRVALISDLSMVLPEPAPERAEKLRQVGQADWQQIEDDEPSVDRITAEIDQSREAIREIVRQLR